jgi:dynein heavy chain 1, cytosolic
VAARHFPGAADDETLARPILYSTWLSRQYRPVRREELRDFVGARLKVCMYVRVCVGLGLV